MQPESEDEIAHVPITDVFDLHAFSPREAKAALEAYLEEAAQRGFRALRIIHGRGIGAQREMVRTVLSRTAGVISHLRRASRSRRLGRHNCELKSTGRTCLKAGQLE